MSKPVIDTFIEMYVQGCIMDKREPESREDFVFMYSLNCPNLKVEANEMYDRIVEKWEAYSQCQEG